MKWIALLSWMLAIITFSVSAEGPREFLVGVPESRAELVGRESFPLQFQFADAIKSFRIVELDLSLLLEHAGYDQSPVSDDVLLAQQNMLFTPVNGESFGLVVRIMDEIRDSVGLHVKLFNSSNVFVGSGSIVVHEGRYSSGEVEIFSENTMRTFKLNKLKDTRYHVVYEFDTAAGWRALGKRPGYHGVDNRSEVQRDADLNAWEERLKGPEYSEIRAKQKLMLEEFLNKEREGEDHIQQK